VARIPLAKLVAGLREAKGGLVTLKEWETVHVGGGARTIAFSPDERFVYAASNARAELVVVDTTTFKVVHRVRTDAFTVGLAVSPDGRQVWTTSQGHDAEGGGRSTCVYAVEQQPAGRPAGT
jgi:DNA-binding beta-propeller fold protein YncE